MAKANFVQDGNIINYTNPTQEVIAYNDVVMLTDCLGVAVSDIQPGETGALKISGVFLLPATAEAMTAGQALYWDATGAKVTGTAADNKRIGIAVEAKAVDIQLCMVKIGG